MLVTFHFFVTLILYSIDKFGLIIITLPSPPLAKRKFKISRRGFVRDTQRHTLKCFSFTPQPPQPPAPFRVSGSRVKSIINTYRTAKDPILIFQNFP